MNAFVVVVISGFCGLIGGAVMGYIFHQTLYAALATAHSNVVAALDKLDAAKKAL